MIYASHLLERRFVQRSPAPVRLVALGILYYAFIILIFQALSPFHAISKTWVIISCILIAVVAHFIWGKLRDLNADVDPIRKWMRDGLNSRWAALIIISGFVVLLSFTRALLMPPLAWDCLTYHLTFAALWLKKGTLLFFKAPDQIAYAALFPINGEIFASWLMLPFQNDLLANIMNFPIMLLGGMTCYAIAKELGLTRKEAGFVPLLICFAPMIYIQITTAYLDIATFTFCSTSVLFTLRYLKTGYGNDCFFACVAAGILLGIKYNGIPAVGLIFIVTLIKTIGSTAHTGFLKKGVIIFISLLIVCILGGRQYIINSLEARNPIYPYPVSISNHEILVGSSYLEEVKDWIADYETQQGWDHFNLWEKEYRKFLYLSLTAGPKFFLFMIIACISLFMKPHNLSKQVWCFLSIMWIIPIVLFYANPSSDFARRAYWIDGSFRFISPYVALFTIQCLVFIRKKMNSCSKEIDLLFIAFIGWDILNINKNHLLEVTVVYPFIIVAVLLVMPFLSLVVGKFKPNVTSDEMLINSPGLSRHGAFATNKCITYAMVIVILYGGLYFLQRYRDSTRYKYFREHYDLHAFPREFVDAWEFLDQTSEEKSIALTMGWDPPGHLWFFYPLFGRWFQNDIEYLSAKYKWEVPTWVDRGMLRGNDYSIWLANLQRKNVQYILVQRPWPIESAWMEREQELFQPVFANKDCKIFKYKGSS